eukprot:TRINITY_DN64_c8_g1_i1.p2 TRINITY_DN64_c8_g1~~TRINITY_DN64_c8_g1_i1.p2  ORF type:complete len:109 (-),score=36.75 TRINITY_DN64_c8_g1_i1:91-417(-)
MANVLLMRGAVPLLRPGALGAKRSPSFSTAIAFARLDGPAVAVDAMAAAAAATAAIDCAAAVGHNSHRNAQCAFRAGSSSSSSSGGSSGDGCAACTTSCRAALRTDLA